jgi:hypothetical protein
MTEAQPAPDAASQARSSGEQGVVQFRRGKGGMAKEIGTWKGMGSQGTYNIIKKQYTTTDPPHHARPPDNPGRPSTDNQNKARPTT